MIRARVKEIRSRSHDLSAIVEVRDVLKSSLVNIPRDTVTLYYNSGCLCPPLAANEEYIILGYENEERSRSAPHAHTHTFSCVRLRRFFECRRHLSVSPTCVYLSFPHVCVCVGLTLTNVCVCPAGCC